MEEYIESDIEENDIVSGEEVGYDANIQIDEQPSAETQEMMIEETQDSVVEAPSGNLHVMIIVVSIFAVIGLALGIWRGIKAAGK